MSTSNGFREGFKRTGLHARSSLELRMMAVGESPGAPDPRVEVVKTDKWAMKKLIKKILPKLGLKLRQVPVLEAILSCLPGRSLLDQCGKAKVVFACNAKLAEIANMPVSTFRRHKAVLVARNIVKSNTGKSGRPSYNAKLGDGADINDGLSLQPLVSRISELLEFENQVDSERCIARQRRKELKARLAIVADDLVHSKETAPAIAASLDHERRNIGRRILHVEDIGPLELNAMEVGKLELELATGSKSGLLKSSVETAQIERAIQRSNTRQEKNGDANIGEATSASRICVRLGLVKWSEEAKSGTDIAANDNQNSEALGAQATSQNLRLDAAQSPPVLPSSSGLKSTVSPSAQSIPDQTEKELSNGRTPRPATFSWETYKRVCPQLDEFLNGAVGSQSDFEAKIADAGRALGITERQAQIFRQNLGNDGYNVLVAYLVGRQDRIRDHRNYIADLTQKAVKGRIFTDRLFRSMLAANLKSVGGTSVQE